MNKSSRVLICGDINWTDGDFIKKYLKKQSKTVEIMYGGGNIGVEKFVGEYIKELSLKVINLGHPLQKANSKEYEIRRLKNMMKYGNPELVIVFYNNIETNVELSEMLHEISSTGLRIIVVGNGYH